MNKFSKSVFLSLFSTLVLSACGGGSSQSENQNDTPSEPIQISESSWNSNPVLSRSIQPLSISTTQNNNFLEVKINGLILPDDGHWQLHLDMDNKPETGFQFEGEAWTNQSGIDYIIEDGVMFKSTANDNSWSWLDSGRRSFKKEANSLTVKFSTANKKLCKNFNIGIITLDKNWKIDQFYPVANNLLKQTTTFCDTQQNHPPVITLNGESPMTVALGSQFIDPGVTARDIEDGDISSNVIAHNTIDTSIPCQNCSIRYSVTDSNGVRATKHRHVIVKDTPSSTGISVDGRDDDWATIAPLTRTSNGTMKVTDDDHYVYILITTNTLRNNNQQLFIDSDNNAQTGFSLGRSAADYMIENQLFNQFTSRNQHQWSWKYGSSRILKAKRLNNWEIGIPKTAMNNLTNKLAFTFSNLDTNWNELFSLPQSNSNARSVEYSLAFPVTPQNQAPIAVDDIVSKHINIRPGSNVYLDVLQNDTDPDGDNLTISHVTRPQHGIARLGPFLTGAHANTIQYTPRGSFSGVDTFNYTVTDTHGKTSTATVTITISRANRPPNAAEDAPTTTSDTPINIDVLLNDSDPDGNPIRILSFTQPDYGVVTEVSISGPSPASRRRHLRFDPQGHVGSITFSYTITDGRSLSPNHTDTTTVTVATTSPTDTTHTGWPVIANESITVKKGQSIMIDVLANDSDPDGDTLILDQVDSGAHGTTTKVNGKVRYTPVAGFTGKDEFWYGVHDGYGHNGAGRVSITVVP